MCLNVLINLVFKVIFIFLKNVFLAQRLVSGSVFFQSTQFLFYNEMKSKALPINLANSRCGQRLGYTLAPSIIGLYVFMWYWIVNPFCLECKTEPFHKNVHKKGLWLVVWIEDLELWKISPKSLLLIPCLSPLPTSAPPFILPTSCEGLYILSMSVPIQ